MIRAALWFLPALAFGLMPLRLGAEDWAVVVANRNHADAADVTGAESALLAAKALETAGFRVVSGSDLAVADLRRLMQTVLDERAADGRIVILLAGHFARSASATWFLGADAQAPDLATVDGQGLSLAAVMDVAALAPGGAAVLLATEPRRLAVGAGLAAGIGPLQVPQGVSVISGDATRVADFAARSLPALGQSLPVMLRDSPDLTAQGFLSPLIAFRPADPASGPGPAQGPDAEAVFWQSTREQATPEAYEAYLKRYPEGRFAETARAEVARIRAEPGRQARLAEEALALSRDDRRAVQRALSLLDFDPKGIDGKFGAGSRAAIAAWQKRNGHEATGFVSRAQIVQLLSQADRRAAEREAEAELRRAEQERQDQIYWNQTGAAGDEAGLRAYLKRFPDGMFAELATDRLAAIEERRRGEAAAQERMAWDLAVQADAIAAYQDYLRRHPEGAFAAEAQTRIEALQAEAALDEDRAGWEAAEAALGLSDTARALIEGRLEALDLRPGPADGIFDDQSRRAIRRFQAAQNLPATGYLDQATMVSLLADGLLKLGE